MEYVLLFFQVLINSIGMLLFKKAMISEEPGIEKSIFMRMLDPFTLLALACMLVALILFGKILKKMDVSIVFPLSFAIGYILIMLGGYIFYHEKISTIQLSGCAFLILGSILVSR